MAWGGIRQGAGRKPRAKADVLSRISDAVELRDRAIATMVKGWRDKPRTLFRGDAHMFLISVYQNPIYPIGLRLKAAVAAIKYEKPRLTVVIVNPPLTIPGEIAEERRQRAIAEMREALDLSAL
jgi:hypothetical protein